MRREPWAGSIGGNMGERGGGSARLGRETTPGGPAVSECCGYCMGRGEHPSAFCEICGAEFRHLPTARYHYQSAHRIRGSRPLSIMVSRAKGAMRGWTYRPPLSEELRGFGGKP